MSADIASQSAYIGSLLACGRTTSSGERWAQIGIFVIAPLTGGAALAKGLFPVLGATGTVGLRVGISAVILLAAFRPRLRRATAAQWRAVIPYGVVLGVMNVVFYLALSRIPLGLAVTVDFIGPLGVAVLGSRRAVDVAWVVLAAGGIALIARRAEKVAEGEVGRGGREGDPGRERRWRGWQPCHLLLFVEHECGDYAIPPEVLVTQLRDATG